MIKDYDDYSSLGITISLFPTECYLSSLIKQEIQHHLYMQIWNLTEMIKKKKKMNYHNSQSSHPGPEPDYLPTNWEKQKCSFQPSHRALELSSDLSPPFWVK